MEIIKETPWSRIRRQNSVDKEFLEIVGNGKPTGSVLEETIVVSATLWISVQKWHSRIRLQILSCSRVREMRREPEGKSPSGRMSRWPCKDFLKGTCTNSFCEKWHPPECLSKFETKILRSDWFAQVNLISVAPMLQNLRIGLRRRQSGKSKVPAKQRGGWPKLVLKLKEQERATFFSPSENRCLPASILKPEEREFCCGLQSVDAYDQQKGLEWCWNGYFDEIVQSYDSHNRQWRSADVWRGNCVCQRIGYILDNESLRKHASSIVAWKALQWKRILPSVKLCVPTEESFLSPLKYIDVSRTTQTNLDVVQEKRIDDYWNIDGSRDLFDSWTGFTQSTVLEEKPPNG